MTGIVGLVFMLLPVAISLSSNGRERMDVNRIVALIPRLLEVGISLSFNGRERMVATGTYGHCGNPDVLNYAIDQGCPRD